jgi:23S rRNA pseudouridine955/2504/2580 synthase
MRCEWVVLEEDHGQKLLDFLKKSIKNPSSNRRIKSWIDAGLCFVNGRTEKFHHTRIALQDTIKLIIPEEVQEPKLEFTKERVLFEDDYILVYNKPHNLTSDQEGLVKHLAAHKKVILTHRLDKDTSGAIITAKDTVIAEEIVQQFRNRKVKKEYLAIAHGKMLQDQGTIENYLGPISKCTGQSTGQTLWGKVDEEDGFFSATDWICLKRGLSASFFRLFPFTGRTHQLRVHLSSLGHPILGDSQYGHEKASREGVMRQMLHSAKLTFWHPYYSKTVIVEAPLPQDFQEVYKKFICDS